jgi:hypothetical protein
MAESSSADFSYAAGAISLPLNPPTIAPMAMLAKNV